MNKKTFTKKIYLSAAAIICASSVSTHAALPTLAEYAFNVDGSIWDSLTVPADPLLSGIDLSSFNLGTGLGSITFTVTGGGNHTFRTFLDLEIDELINTFFNEV